MSELDSQVGLMSDVRSEFRLRGMEDTVAEHAKTLGKKLRFEIAENPRITALKTQYEALPQEDRTCNIGVMTWEELESAIPDMNEFLAGIDSLSAPEIYWLDKDGRLVVGDGCAEAPEETIGLDYNQARSTAMKVKNRGLITLDEYERKNKGQFDLANLIWLESGENPSVGLGASWKFGRVISNRYVLYDQLPILGSRRVLRVKLSL